MRARIAPTCGRCVACAQTDRARSCAATRSSSTRAPCRSASATGSRRSSSGTRRRDATFAVVSNPEFLREGNALGRLHAARSGGAGLDQSRGRRAGGATLPDPALPGDGHRSAHRRDDQVRLQRLSRHQHLLHQRDRPDLRAAGRRREGGRRRDGLRQADRRRLPGCGPRLRRQLLPEGREGPRPHGGLQRLPSATAARRAGHQLRSARPRAVAKLREALGEPAGQADRPARAGLQAEHRRYARGALGRSGARSCRPRAPPWPPTIRRRRRTPAHLLAGVRYCATPTRWRAGPMRWCW